MGYHVALVSIRKIRTHSTRLSFANSFVLHVAAATFLQQLRQLQQQLRHEQQHSFVARWGSKISCLCKLFVDNFVCYKSPHATRPDRGLYAKDSQPSNREENRRPWSDVAKTKALKRTPPARTRSAFWPWPIAALMTPLLSAQVPKCCLSSSIPCQSSATFQAHAKYINNDANQWLHSDKSIIQNSYLNIFNIMLNRVAALIRKHKQIANEIG